MAALFPSAPPPPSGLGYYRRLGTLAGVNVSPIALGGLSVGQEWKAVGVTGMSKEESFVFLDKYFELGGNFIDTANAYSFGKSEEFIGEWAEERGIRDQLFLATKYTNNPHLNNPDIKQKHLFDGNGLKSLHLNIDISLKRLRTTYIDLYYVHWWDYSTTIPELMRSLHSLVMQRKVLYLGISDTPAWVVSKANEYARCHGLTPFSVYQGKWNIMARDFERDIIPMARDEGMALAPWGVLAEGKIRSDEEEERRRQTGEKGREITFTSPGWERTEEEKKVCNALEKVKEDVGAKHLGAVAIAYVLHKTQYVFPIIGGRKIEQLVANIEALEISLTPEHITFLDSVVKFDPGFPHNLIGDGSFNAVLNNSTGHIAYWPRAQPIVPAKLK
ncbi:hypothetical protein NMY22_g8615 [Coprinellus aureogranulatus]|nr:hypothetical protein NMY22_g8615 [Coprinellus aureogranulatus]